MKPALSVLTPNGSVEANLAVQCHQTLREDVKHLSGCRLHCVRDVFMGFPRVTC